MCGWRFSPASSGFSEASICIIPEEQENRGDRGNRGILMKPQTATPANRASVESKEFEGNQKPPAWGGFVKLLLNSRKLGLASVPQTLPTKTEKNKGIPEESEDRHTRKSRFPCVGGGGGCLQLQRSLHSRRLGFASYPEKEETCLD